jgi:nitrogen regulation protein NR(I)
LPDNNAKPMTAELKSPPLPVILVIDDDNEIRYSLDRVLSSRRYRVVTAGSGEEGMEALKRDTPDVVFLDIRMGGISGLETLQRLRHIDPQAVVILMTAFGTTQTAIEAMKFGAFDYIMKPFDVQKVLQLAENACKARRGLQEAARHKPTLNSEDYEEGIVGRSEAMQEVFKVIGQVAPSDVTVLVTGESGTGKELVARCIHQYSARARKPFVAVNCAAIPENLIESELFGHERGSFTGATGQRVGRFEQCDGGTIFLDEIGDMALPTQTKILRVLQEGEIQRVGGAGTIKVDVRVIAATNRNLEEMVAERSFREDLYYRLNVVRLRLPPLRERMDDLPLLVDFLLQKLEKSGKARAKRLAPDAMVVLRRHRWPGNVRELENAIYRSAVMAQGEVILVRDLPAELRSGGEAVSSFVEAPPPAPPVPESLTVESGAVASAEPGGLIGGNEATTLLDSLYQRLRENTAENILSILEREMITRALQETGGNQVKASAILGITRTTLRKRIQELSLKCP